MSKIKSAKRIQEDAREKFEQLVDDKIQTGSVIDMLLAAIGEEETEIYDEIDKNRTPHVWSSLNGDRLDSTGVMLNLPRKTNESDANYRFRLMRWTTANEAGNQRAINDALLLPKYASNIQFKPMTKGSGTATCYVIPRDYSEQTIKYALVEAKEKVEEIASPGLYVEYITPKIKGVKLQIYLSVNEKSDAAIIKKTLSEKILEYINNIAPNDFLEVGKINKIGIMEPNVDYFNVLSVMIDGQTADSLKILQRLDTKLLFDEIIWSGDE